LGNTTAVVVNTADAARKLFVINRSGIMSRPIFYVLHKKVSKVVASIGTSPWDESCRQRRKLAAAALNRPRVESYAPIQNLESREFLRDVLSLVNKGSDKGPDADVDFRVPVQKFSLNLSLTLNYGTRVSSANALHDDPLMAEIIQVESAVSRFRDTSKNYANYIPILRYWEPVAEALSRVGSSKSEGEDASDIGRRRLAYNDVLLNRLRDQVAKGEDRPCIQGAVLRDAESATLTREELISVSLSMMAVSEAESTRI
jgi:3-hydroxyphenylacetate 6-hydroxylase